MITLLIQNVEFLVADVGAQRPRPSGGHEGVPVRVDAEVVPVDPGQPRRQVGRVPVHAARRPQLTAEALLDVGHWLEVAEEDLAEQGDVGDGQPQGVDLAETLLVGEGGHVSSELLEGGVDGGAVSRPPVVRGLPRGHLLQPHRVEVVLTGLALA